MKSTIHYCLAALLAGAFTAAAGTLAQFRTTFGDIEVELYDQDKPMTVRNFKRLVESGAYLNTFFHRLEPGFVIQGGGFATPARYTTNLFAPPWLYLQGVPNFGNITNEFRVGRRLSNTNGTIAMAKTSDPNSANSQFFFSLGDNSLSLDNTNNSGGFTVFGHVVRDANQLLSMFNAMSYWHGVVPMGVLFPSDSLATNLFKTLPVTFDGAYYPRYGDLLFVDISLLQVAVKSIASGKEISWNSAASMTNIVEFTTNLPPVWNTLLRTNGTGGRLAVVDAAATPRRFYRVRVE
jgi:peptidyl-prolyl cis-trans isomerase A (cyclophilin A)